MPKLARWSAAAILLLPMAALAADSTHLSPGRWSESLRMDSATIDGRALGERQLDRSANVRHVCIGAEEAADPRRYFTAHTSGGECSAPEGVVADGRIDLSATCGAMAMRMTGSFASDRFDAVVSSSFDRNGKRAEMRSRLEGRLVGACDGSEE